MEKRLFLAIALSLLVLLSWSAWVSKTHHLDNKGVTSQLPIQAKATVPKDVDKERALLSEEPGQPLLSFPVHNAEILFNERHGAINKVIFNEKREHIFPLYFGFLTDDGKVQYKRIQSKPGEMVFVHQDATKKIIKQFLFDNTNNIIELQIEVHNLSSSALEFKLPIVLSRIDLSNQNPQYRYQDIYIMTQEKSRHLSPAKEYRAEGVKLLGFRDRYFCLLVEPDIDSFAAVVTKLNNKMSELKLDAGTIIIAPGSQIGHSFRIYLGPQDLDAISAINPNWSGIIYFGTFDFIGQILLQLLGFFYHLVHNWGAAIIILSVAVYLILFPLTLKQMRSMKEMQHIQPKVEELRKLYKNNPQKLNKEIMELYKEHKVNPLGGCLPLVLQMPIFFALYQALMRSVALRGAGFLWIKDLSQPDQLSLFGTNVNILPIFMAIGMFIQQKISMGKVGKGGAEQQKIMLIVMPVMFGVIFYNMPSGLVLYWFVNSTLMLLYQLRIYNQR